MADSGKALQAGLLITTSEATAYTVPAATTAAISYISICNTSASAATFTLWFVASGSGADATCRYKNISVPAYSTWESIATRFLPTGSLVRVIAGTTNVLSIYISGIEIT